MSHNHCILKTLNIKDQNIKFDEEFCKDIKIRGILSKVYDAKLAYAPQRCTKCYHSYDSSIIKYGFKSSLIVLPKVSEFNTYLRLKKQRYYCKHCNKTFSLSTGIVKKNCYISKNTRLAISIKARNKLSEKDIAKDYNVSHCTVNRLIDDSYNEYKPKYNYLPKHLCFDEFKSVKSAAGAMSFIFCDSATGTIIDIVEDRRLESLKTYFNRYSYAARHSVKTIVIDIYTPYISLIKLLFPKADIIIDKFHVVQLFSRALNKTRIKIMNQNTKYYNKLKKHWRLLLMDEDKLNCISYYYRPCFRDRLREVDIIKRLLEISPELKRVYRLYHDIRSCIKTKNVLHLEELFYSKHDDLSSYMATAIKTAKKHHEYISNTLIYNYSNGVLEGINNKIKVIKRIAFGYRSFYHFKNRIMITQNLVFLKET